MSASNQLQVALLLLTITVYGSQALDLNDISNTMKSGMDSMRSGLSSLGDAVKNSACMIQNRDKFDACNSELNSYSSSKLEQDKVKDYCCAVVKYRSCVDSVAKSNCGEQASEIADSVLSAFKNNMLSDDCDSYNNMFDCMDDVVFFSIVGVVALIGIIIIISLICCLKRMCC